MHCDCLVSAESEKVHRNECRSIGYFEEFVLKKTSFKMNTAPFESDPTQRKKAVHVKVCISVFAHLRKSLFDS